MRIARWRRLRGFPCMCGRTIRCPQFGRGGRILTFQSSRQILNLDDGILAIWLKGYATKPQMHLRIEGFRDFALWP